MSIYPTPGRGAWTKTGGLLTAKPGLRSSAGFYRLATATEIPVGSAWANRQGANHHHEAVWLGVRAIQQLVGAEADGWFGVRTEQRVKYAQDGLGLEVDGIVGRATMRMLLMPLVEEAAKEHGVPVELLGGLLVHESMLDPAAVGVSGDDHGVAQINLAAHGATVRLEDAMDPGYSIQWAAADLARVYQIWKGKTKADPWDIAIANHNSPLLAKRWANNGAAPFVKDRVFQIEEYVQKVRVAWNGA